MDDDHRSRLIEHYDRLAGRYERLYQASNGPSHFYRARQEALKTALGTIDGGMILEVGCGAGLTTSVFVSGQTRYHGVDISPGMIDAARRRHTDDTYVHFSVADMCELPFPEGSFDVVACMGAIEYVRDESLAISEMARVLRGDGTLLLSGITKWSPFNLYKRSVYRRIINWKPACIVREFHTEREYAKLMRASGLEPATALYFDFSVVPPPLDSAYPRLARRCRNFTARLAAGPLKRLGNGFILTANRAR